MIYVAFILNGIMFGVGLFLANVLVEALFHRHLIS